MRSILLQIGKGNLESWNVSGLIGLAQELEFAVEKVRENTPREKTFWDNTYVGRIINDALADHKEGK